MKILISNFLLILLFSCNSQNNNRNNSITYIDEENLKIISDFNPMQLIDSCTYIPLETSEQCLIGNINELQVTEKYIFLSDYNTNNLLMFDRNGKFLNKIGHQGRGPQEYQYLRSFCLTPSNDTVIIYDGNLFRLQLYTTDNQYIGTFNLDKYMHRDSNVFRYVNGIRPLEKGKLLLNYNYMHLCQISFSVYDYQKDSLYDIGYMPFQVTMDNPNETFSTDDPIVTRYEGSTSCCIPFNDTVFQYQNNSLQPRIVIPALKGQTIDDKLKHFQNGKNGTNAIRLLARNGLFITSIHECENYFFITYCDQAMAKEIIWNKKQNKGILVSSFNYYGYQYAPHEMTMSEIFDKENDSPLYHTPQLEKLKPHLQEDDNPVIAIYHLKAEAF